MQKMECVVSGVLGSALLVGRCLGFAPLHFQRQGNGWRVRLSRTYTLLGNIIVTILSLIAIWALFCSYQLHNPMADSAQSIWKLDVMMTIGILWAMVYRAPKLTLCLVRSLNKVDKIDAKFNTHCWSSAENRNQVVLLITLSIFGVSLTTVTGVSIVTFLLNENNDAAYDLLWNVQHLIYFSFNLLVLIYDIQFVLVILRGRAAFRVVNERFGILFKDELAPQSAPEYIRAIGAAYTLACDIVRDVNKSFGEMMMTLLTFLFMRLVAASYYFFSTLIHFMESETYENTVTLKLLQALWCIYYFLNLMLLVEPCHSTHTEMAAIRGLLSRAILSQRVVNNPFGEELEKFYKQVLLNNVLYRPLDVVTLSRSLVLSILGSLTTYLVILVNND